MERSEIFEAINAERNRQDKLHPMPKVRESESADINAIENLIISSEFLAVLVEELGEIGSAMQGDGDLKTEIIHTASVAVRWLEQLK